MPRRGSGLVSAALEYDRGRQVTAFVPSGVVDAIVYAADGGWHVERLGQALADAGVGSTLVVGVHGLQDDDERLAEYVLGIDSVRFAAHERFFVDRVPQWIAAEIGVALPADRSAVWGASLGAEFALAMGIRHPDVYGAVFAASPGAGFRPPSVWPEQLPLFYMTAGDQEPFFLENARTWATALGQTGAASIMTERSGDHGGAFWFEEFPAMVARAFRVQLP